MNDLDTGVYASHSEYKKENARHYFKRVVEGYREVRLLSPIVASNCDPLAPPTKLDVTGIHFLCDVTLGTRKALHDDPKLLDEWERIVDGEDVPNKSTIEFRCGVEYQRRSLAPSKYFHFVREGRKRKGAV